MVPSPCRFEDGNPVAGLDSRSLGGRIRIGEVIGRMIDSRQPLPTFFYRGDANTHMFAHRNPDVVCDDLVSIADTRILAVR